MGVRVPHAVHGTSPARQAAEQAMIRRQDGRTSILTYAQCTAVRRTAAVVKLNCFVDTSSRCLPRHPATQCHIHDVSGCRVYRFQTELSEIHMLEQMQF